MRNGIVHRKKTRARLWLRILLIAAAATAAAACVLLALSHPRIEFYGLDADTAEVECFTGYDAPEVTAALKGDLLFRGGHALAVTRTGEVDADRIGTYAVTWRAGIAGFSAERVCSVDVVDTTPPELTLAPETRAYILPGEEYDDPGYTAVDRVDGDLTAEVERTVNGSRVDYSVSDRSGNIATASRIIPYDDPVPPVIALRGDSFVSLTVGEEFYSEPGFSASDNLDGNLSDAVTVSGSVDESKAGLYTLTYTVTDLHGNKATAKRTILMHLSKEASAELSAAGPEELPDKVIYLTFDDGPGAYTAKLLDVLKKYDVKATFFVVKTKRTDLIAREAAEGHTVAIHSATHVYRTIYASEEAYFNDLWTMNEIIREKTGSYANLVRFPGGSSNAVSRFNPGIMTRLTAAVEEVGFRYYDWNVSSGDAGGTTTSDGVFDNVISGVRGKKYSVVLQHDIKGFSVDAVERIIVWGLENGYTFLPLTADSPTVHHKVKN